jgi:hypothetical protein
MEDDGQPMFMMDGWDLQFQTGDKGFFKTSEVYELDEYYGDVYSLIIGCPPHR